MVHIDEHTLELFLLGDEGVQDEKERIEAHIAACEGCRALAAEMAAFYAGAGGVHAAYRDRPARTGAGLVKRRRDVSLFDHPHAKPDRSPVPAPRSAMLERAYDSARRHPARAAMASFAVFGVLVFAFTLSMQHSAAKGNPSYVHYNLSENKIEVYGTNDDLLWELVSQASLASIKVSEEQSLCPQTLVTDLDDDGVNEVLTIIPIGGQTAEAGILRVYNADKKLIREVRFPGRAFNYGANHYESAIGISVFTVGDFTGSGEKEIVVVTQNGRSPAIVGRFGTDGTMRGEYYHYGNLWGLYAVDVHHDGKKELILCGMNDVYEDSRVRPAVIVVLDPAKITGKSQSYMTPAFGLPTSPAEVFYIQLPENDITRLLNVHSAVQSLIITDTLKQLRFYTVCRLCEDNQPSFEFLFTHDMENFEVKGVDQTTRLHDKLVREGRLTGTIDAAYLKALNDGVIYHIRDGVRIVLRKHQMAENSHLFPAPRIPIR